MKKRWTFWAAALVILAGCERNSSAPLQTFNEGFDWVLPPYEIEQMVYCFCAPPANQWHKLTVRENAIVAVDGAAPTELEMQMFKTIEQLHEFIADVESREVAFYRVEYDSTYGYPTDLYVDFNAGIADEEIGYRNRNVRTVQ